MEDNQLHSLLETYNPWWEGRDWETRLPGYCRPIVGQIGEDLEAVGQVISISGPRRVGKSTAMRQLIAKLIAQGAPPENILYCSMDDPQIMAKESIQEEIFESMIRYLENHGKGGRKILFLDEIHRLPRWELHIKKAYDLGSAIRFVISGSASAVLFRLSQESLLGRILDRHLYPFNFREYCEHYFQGKKMFEAATRGRLKQALLNDDASGALKIASEFEAGISQLSGDIEKVFKEYVQEGGFPEVWGLKDPIRKNEYLMEQQVRKVLYEDLMSIGHYRKPENILRFFIFLLTHPGMELNLVKIASETGISRQVIEDNLPLLEKTDLIFRVGKFSRQPLRVRQGNIKVYPMEPAIRNALLKITRFPDDDEMGKIAENLVMRELMDWRERVEISFYREKVQEIDVVLTHSGNKMLPMEVKYRETPDELRAIETFRRNHALPMGVVITKNTGPKLQGGLLKLPLRTFLLA